MSINREERRALKKKIAPIAKEVARLEKNIKNQIEAEQSERRIEEIMEGLTILEMMAVEDYIYSHDLI